VRQGKVVVEEVPAPIVEDGTVLVRVAYSCISSGTELAAVRQSGKPLLRRVLEQPEKAARTLAKVADYGVIGTMAMVRGKLASAAPTGYSAAGTVIAVGHGITDISLGDRVSCAGDQYAHHAEIIRVPRNLVVAVPDSLGLNVASTVALGSIALQGIRRANPTLGEVVVVAGLGLLGQITTQLLKSNGCRVIGVDPLSDRVTQAMDHGADFGVFAESGDSVEQVIRLTHGFGADAVIVTAASLSDDIISAAFRMCRKKGRVVLVGSVGLNIDRGDIYRKELDFLISTSYGPGRYEESYERHGLDYPINYVRWTENRNMAEFLRQLAAGRVCLDRLISRVFPVSEAGAAYAELAAGSPPLLVLLRYEGEATKQPLHRTPTRTLSRPIGGVVRVGLIGAGGFAKGVHLPNLASLRKLFCLRAVASRSGHGAAMVAKQFGAEYATTDVEEVIADHDIDAVIIATRHDLHAQIALRALAAGKHVFLEKPMATRVEDLARIAAFFDDGTDVKPILLTGFNRRFSPFAKRAASLLAGRSSPLMVDYRMNAGYLHPDHWTHSAEGGGRNIGEACHIYDLFTYLTNGRAVRSSAACIASAGGYYSPTDNFVATIAFADGSLAALTYTALGSPDHPKERCEIYCDGKVVCLDDYRVMTVAGTSAKGLSTSTPDKGHLEELKAFGEAIRSGGPWPIPLWQQVQATEISFEVDSFLHS
jgi:predicted dehydrogenase/threonine dehydrogenase-like Zn-dependent dehydrogenase